MRIQRIQLSKKPGGLDIKALLGTAEYRQLQGRFLDLRIFSRSSLTLSASVVKTGSKHSYTKYLLFPVALRRKFRTDACNFDRVRCGVIRHKDSLYAIYEIPFMSATPESGDTESDPTGEPSNSDTATRSRK